LDSKIIERANRLLDLIHAETAGPDDYEELMQLMEAHPEPWLITHVQTYFSRKPLNVPGDMPSSHSPAWRKVLQNVLEADKSSVDEVVGTPVRPVRTWWRVAAAVALLVAAGAWYFVRINNEALSPVKQMAAIPVEPGKDGAILTLADGSTIVLDSLGNGQVSAQAGARVMLKDGQLAYEPTGKGTGAVAWNTISTPRARQFRITLPDGTQVWLNAATVLHYPTAFTGSERKVQLTGEAYFEVAQNAHQPFRVMIGDTAAVEVLGTSFNINSYADEPVVRTTLLEGSVRMKKKQETVLLQPGEQAVMQHHISVSKNVDVAGVVAWKSGKFNFEGVSLEEFMRQLARWYDIEVEYRGNTPKMVIRGKPGRDLQLQDLLDALADFGIRYKLEGRKLIIN